MAIYLKMYIFDKTGNSIFRILPYFQGPEPNMYILVIMLLLMCIGLIL